MPTPDQTQRGYTVTTVDGRVRLAFALDHEIGARCFDLSDREAADLGRTLTEAVIRIAREARQ